MHNIIMIIIQKLMAWSGLQITVWEILATIEKLIAFNSNEINFATVYSGTVQLLCGWTLGPPASGEGLHNAIIDEQLYKCNCVQGVR